ncbi:19034_t:CDS:2 [Entrophospora sp. SA101]|nr:19034_t:CDS:2 [Entrophospora sp. SA101]
MLCDHKLARDWVLNCESEKSPSISIQNTFTGGTLTIGTDNEVSTRQIKSKLHNMESGEMTPDYCELLTKQSEVEAQIHRQRIKETNVKEDPDLSSKLYGNLAHFCNKNNIKEIRKIMK